MNKYEKFDLSATEWQHLINEWILDSKIRAMLKDRIIDGLTYEELAYKYKYDCRNVGRIITKAEHRLFRIILKQREPPN